MQLIPVSPPVVLDDTNVPLVPEHELRKAHAFIASDSRFKATARFLASIWRRDHSLPIGSIARDGERQKLGSLISEAAGRVGHNFGSIAIRDLAARELIYRQRAAMYDATRLRTNLLASQTLAFNVFGPMAIDPKLAARMVQQLFPGTLADVSAVRFEYAPSRGDARFGADNSAWDAVILGHTSTGARGLIAIEVKFTESCEESGGKPISAQFQAMAPKSGLYLDSEAAGMKSPAHRQLIREHLMAQAVVDHGMVEVGWFAVVSPYGNHLARRAAEGYGSLLSEPAATMVPYIYRTLEEVLEALAGGGHEKYAQSLFERYLDFGRVAVELGLQDRPVAAGAFNALQLPA